MRRWLAAIAVITALAGGVAGTARADNYYAVQQYIDQVCGDAGGCNQSYEQVSNIYQGN